MIEKNNFDYNVPLNQQEFEPNELFVYLQNKDWIKKNTRIRITSAKSGLLLNCPKCKSNNKFFYSFENKMFLCLDYSNCGFKVHKLLKLKQSFEKGVNSIETKTFEPIKSKSNNLLTKEVYEVYVDYALHSKVGIWSNKPLLRLSLSITSNLKIANGLDPSEDIKWQIEGEALAIKLGVYYFLQELGRQKKFLTEKLKGVKLILYTDNTTLLKPFRSSTMAGKWWSQAQDLARGIELEIKFISGKENPADILTRSKAKFEELAKRDKSYYYQEWLKKQNNSNRIKANVSK